MDARQNYLSQLQTYVEGIDKEVTFILQSLQWDRKHLLETLPMVTCKYDANHKIPPDKLECHERECFLKSQGYNEEDKMLPEPFETSSNTVVHFTTEDIKFIINEAASKDPNFRRGEDVHETEPLTDARLRCAYTADERRAIHDAAVRAAPACHDLSDLALTLPGNPDEAHTTAAKSRAEVLAELRDMKRRRTKYRVAAKTKNYSDVLRDVIKTQMEFYAEAQENTRKESLNKDDTNSHNNASNSASNARGPGEINRKRERERSEDRSKETTKDRTREDIPRKSHRDDSNRQSESRRERSRERIMNDERYESSRNDRDHDRYRDSRHERNSDRFRDSRHGRDRDRYKGRRHDEDCDRYRTRDLRRNGRRDHDKGSDKYNNTRYRHSNMATDKIDRRNRVDYKEGRSQDITRTDLLEVKTEIKEEYDFNNEGSDTDEKSKHTHKSKKHKKHKERKRSSKSKERTIIKVKEEKLSPRRSDDKMFDD